MTTPKSKKNSGKPWTKQEIQELKKLSNGNTPTGVISLKMGRTKQAIYTKASEKNISLHPTNKSPYNRKNK
ncbi:MAG: hypothetical protein ACD_18C00273G0004 [uncultured bacterium]|nr:MAG: hypothetical protein ACD_18C00273G0004 [uncultured bacterium]